MKKILGLLMLTSVFCQATTNQLEFNYGRGSPRGSYHFDNFVNQEGPRGPEWSADFLHKMSGFGYLGLGGGHFHSGDDMSETFAPNATSDLVLKTTSIMALGRIDLNPNPKLTPYLLVGVGWVQNTLTVTSVPLITWPDTGTSESRILAEDSKSTLGYEAGFGLDLALTTRLFIGLEAKYQGSVKRSFNLTPAGQAATGQSQVTVPLGAILVGAKVGMKY